MAGDNTSFSTSFLSQIFCPGSELGSCILRKPLESLGALNYEAKKPETTSHMVLWGIWSGTILAILYQAFFFGWKQENSALLIVLTNPVFWGIGFVTGGLPEGLMGWTMDNF